MNIIRYQPSGNSAVFEDTQEGQDLANSMGFTFDKINDVESKPEPLKKLTKKAFLARFPSSADGVSSKFDLMTLFLMSDSYAESLGVTGAAMHTVRALIVAGKNQFDVAPYVNFELDDAANFTMLMAAKTTPKEFRLSKDERDKMLTDPITEQEAYKP